MFVILILHTLILRSGDNIAILPNARLGYKIIIIIALVLPSMLQTTVNSYCDTHTHTHTQTYYTGTHIYMYHT